MHPFLRIAAAVILVAACTPTTGDLGGVDTPPPTALPSLDAPSSEPTPGATAGPLGSPGSSPAGTTTVRAYFFLGSFVDNAGLAPVLRDVPTTKAVGTAAIQALLVGLDDQELGARPAMYTDVPSGTRLLGLTIDNGIATVNLTKEFNAGGDSASVRGRLAQVVYTLTQFPTITSVKFLFDGLSLLVFKPAYTRSDFADELPAIFVDRPAWGGVLGNPARLVGLANVFEATFRAEILDGAGRTLAAAPVTASCGSGCLGTFDVTIHYDVSTAGWGTLRVSEPSAKDGSPTNTTEYPVWLTP